MNFRVLRLPVSQRERWRAVWKVQAVLAELAELESAEPVVSAELAVSVVAAARRAA